MTYEEAQGPAAYSVVEVLCWLLVKNGVVSKAELESELERYAKMHEGAPGADGTRSPEDPEVARAMRFVAGIAGQARP